MIILALESDPALAVAVRHVVCDLVRAKLTLVQSIDLAVQALHKETPDLILLPALVSPAEEAQLLTVLRTLPNCAHVEVLMTPVLEAPEAPKTLAPRGWRRWGSHRASTRARASDELRLFAQRLGWSLQGARQRKQVTQEHSPQDEMPTVDIPNEVASTPDVYVPQAGLPAAQPREIVTPSIIHRFDTNRRAHRRFTASELQGLRTARIKSGPPVVLLDVSAGGALIETEARLQPESEAMLEIISDLRRTLVPFRVVRSQISALDGSLRYRGACVFSQPLDVAELVESNSVDMETHAAIDNPRLPHDAFTTMMERYQPSLQRYQEAELRASSRTPGQPADPFSEMREHVRVSGPFDGLRLGAIETPVRILDLSEGGCFVDTLVEAKAGRRLSLGLLVPGEDWITVTGEVVRAQPEFGFAVRFVELPDTTRASLGRVIASRKGSAVTDEVPERLMMQSA